MREDVFFAVGMCGLAGLVVLTTVNICLSEHKPFTKKWFIGLISFIPEDV